MAHKTEETPLAIVVEERLNDNQVFELSFEKLFKFGTQYYVSFMNNQELCLAKLSQEENGKYTITDITSKDEFSFVCDAYRKRFL